MSCFNTMDELGDKRIVIVNPVIVAERHLAVRVLQGNKAKIRTIHMPRTQWSNGVVVVLRNRDIKYDKDNLRGQLSILVEKFFLILGVNSVFYDFKDLKRYYDECNLAIKYGEDENSTTSIHFFEDYVIKHLTRFVFVENGKNQFVNGKVELLHKYDQQNDTELVETLLTYFLNGQSKSLAARKMHLHRNSLAYRLETINKLSGIDCNGKIMNENEIFHIMLSCEFLRFRTGIGNSMIDKPKDKLG